MQNMKPRELILPLIILLSIQQATASHMLVYGKAFVDGKPVPPGTVIVARIVDEEVGNCTLAEEGFYGILIATDEREHSPMEFYAGNLRAIQVVTCTPESVLAIDLDFRSMEETTTLPKVEPPVNVIQEPGIVGRVVSYTNKGGAVVGFILVFALITYSLRDLL
jgi:hypothetical protein